MTRRAKAPAFTGFVYVDKPEGWTSHDVVARLRRTFDQREVGHTGTLDPMATGLLVVALGRATRLARFVEAEDKTYEGTVVLGVATDTYDATGEVLERRPVSVEAQAVDRVLAGLTGEVDQAVPPYSAVKVGGERLYARARRKEAVETPVRRVRISSLERLALDGPALRFRTEVSKGTYVRSLAVQIGRGLGVPAHLGALRRTRVGAIAVEGARGPEAFRGDPAEVVSPARVLSEHCTARLDAEGAEAVGFGRPLRARQLRDRTGAPWRRGAAVVLTGPDEQVAAVGEATVDEDQLGVDPETVALRYLCVLAPASS